MEQELDSRGASKEAPLTFEQIVATITNAENYVKGFRDSLDQKLRTLVGKANEKFSYSAAGKFVFNPQPFGISFERINSEIITAVSYYPGISESKETVPTMRDDTQWHVCVQTYIETGDHYLRFPQFPVTKSFAVEDVDGVVTYVGAYLASFAMKIRTTY